MAKTKRKSARIAKGPKKTCLSTKIEVATKRRLAEYVKLGIADSVSELVSDLVTAFTQGSYLGQDGVKRVMGSGGQR